MKLCVSTPGYAAAHTNLGILLSKAGKLDEADRHFTEALRLNPGDSKARAGLENLKHR
jgi:Flp pilus assembly protein TadD